MAEEFLSIQEVWAILGQRWPEKAPALSTVKQWARDGRFVDARIIGNSYVIPRTALDGFERPKLGRPTERGRVKPDRLSSLGYIYLIGCEEGYYKIGRSKTPMKRISHLSSTIPPFDFELLHLISADKCKKAEYELHQRFGEKRKKGEWFELNEADVKFIKSISEYRNGKFICCHTATDLTQTKG